MKNTSGGVVKASEGTSKLVEKGKGESERWQKLATQFFMLLILFRLPIFR